MSRGSQWDLLEVPHHNMLQGSKGLPPGHRHCRVAPASPVDHWTREDTRELGAFMSMTG